MDIKKKFNKDNWTAEYTLTPDQVKKLIKDKFERAKQLHQQQAKKVPNITLS
jgi:uncharacterized protein YcaQ